MTDTTGPNPFALALDRQSRFLDDLLAPLRAEDWERPTPAEGWSVRDQVGHLTFIYRIADLAVRDADAFAGMMASAPSMDAAIQAQVDAFRAMEVEEVRAAWEQARDSAVASFGAADPTTPVPWLVNPLPPAVLAAAGLMETFAHGQDVADAVGTDFPDSPILEHVVAFAVKVRDFGYEAHGIAPPPAEFRFEIDTVDGRQLVFGPEDAQDRVTGSARDFCLLVTRRRHPDDVDVQATGPNAPAWLEIAQAYRGNPGSGRAPATGSRLSA